MDLDFFHDVLDLAYNGDGLRRFHNGLRLFHQVRTLTLFVLDFVSLDLVSLHSVRTVMRDLLSFPKVRIHVFMDFNCVHRDFHGSCALINDKKQVTGF